MKYRAFVALSAVAVGAAALIYVASRRNGRNDYRTDDEMALGEHPGIPEGLGSYIGVPEGRWPDSRKLPERPFLSADRNT